MQPNDALCGHKFCTQSFDNVRVHEGYLLGAENGGWPVLTGHLASERIQVGGSIVKVQLVFEQLCRLVADDPDLADNTYMANVIGQYAAELEAARQLSPHSIPMLEGGKRQVVEGAMTKVFSGDLSERINEAAISILGAEALLGEDKASAPPDGQIEQSLRRSIKL